MAADIKPGDLVRDNRVWTVEAVNGDSAHLSLDGHTRLAGTHYLEPVPAAPASEPKTQDLAAKLRHEAEFGSGFGNWRDLCREAARHLAERDARIKELDRDVRARIAHYDAACAQRSQAVAEKVAAEDRARAAEADLAAEREANGRLREALEPFVRADIALADDDGPYRLETLTGYRQIERQAFRQARAASRTITAEGAAQSMGEIRLTEAQRRFLGWLAGDKDDPSRPWCFDADTRTTEALLRKGLATMKHGSLSATEAGRSSLSPTQKKEG